MDLQAAIRRERIEIADALERLTPEQWSSASCCKGWSVQEVAAHLTQGWNTSFARSTWEIVRARGDLGALSDRLMGPLHDAGPAAIVADMRANADNPWSPPMFDLRTPLNDLVIHRRDMFLPLGISYEPNPEAVVNSLDLAPKRGKYAMLNRSRELRGLRFEASDVDWAHGSGPVVRGPALPLAHAMWGRTMSLGELEGDGVAVLRSRLA